MPSQVMFNRIEKLRNNPISHAATFIDSMKHFRDSALNISHEVQVLFNKQEENVLIEQLRFLKQLVFSTEHIIREGEHFGGKKLC